MYEFNIEGNPQYLHNSVGSFSWDGKTWHGLSGLITDDGEENDGSLTPSDLTFSLTAWIQEIVAASRNQVQIGQMCRKLHVPRDMTTNALIGDPKESWRGTMGPIFADPNSQVISMTAEDERKKIHDSIGAVFENPEFQARDNNSGWLRRPESEADEYNSGDTFFVDSKKEKDKKGPRYEYKQ